jgi:putative DNA primase/helicase
MAGRAVTTPSPQQAAWIDDPFPFTDLGNAERFVKLVGDTFRFCPQWGSWLYWDGKRWARDETGEAMRAAKNVVVSMLEEAKRVRSDEKRRGVVRWHLQSQSEPRLRSMLSLAQTEPGVPVVPSQLDSNPWLLNTQNCTVNLELGREGRHFKQDLITKLAGTEYRGELAECPRWLEFLGEVFDGDSELIGFVQRAVGYSLTGITTEQVLFILWGTGANGKSTLLETLRLALGNYALATDFQTFLVKRNDSIRSDLARLAGARFVTATEAEQGGRLSESVVKQLTGGDVVTARFLYREYFEFKSQFKIWLAANHKPQVRGTDNAIWRRIRLIPFRVTIPPERQDRHLMAKFKKELPGILQWAIDGCLSWREMGLDPPAAVRTATDDYRSEMDVLGAFLAERCLMADNASVSARGLYTEYKNWCATSGEYCHSQTRFGRMLTERGFQKEKLGTVRYTGLSLKEPVGVDSGR